MNTTAPSSDIGEGPVGEHGLRHDPGEREHCQPSVLELPDLHPLDLGVGLSLEDVEGVKGKVSGLSAGAHEHLGDSDPRDHLGEADEEEELSHGAVLDELWGVFGVR